MSRMNRGVFRIITLRSNASDATFMAITLFKLSADDRAFPCYDGNEDFLSFLHFSCNSRPFFLLEGSEDTNSFKRTMNPMKETMPPVMSLVANAISVTHCYSPSLQGCTDTLPISLSHCPALPTHEESVFSRQGDYWTIRYQGHVAFLKATRGLQCLSFLLRHPGREFHVSELLGQVIGGPLVLDRGRHATGAWQGGRLSDAGPILDAQAKTEYKHRLDDLREDLEEAERFNDPDRAARVRTEMNAVAEQLASAVGLGGRDRRIGSEAERARCAVTKRIKDSINKIGEAIPSLRRHLAARVHTGYFCFYNPNPEHPVAWKF